MSDLTNSQRLRKKIQLVLPELFAAIQSFMKHPQITALYPEYLFVLHTMMRASVPLMEEALEVAKTREAYDPVASGLVTYLTQHIREELYHDDWLLEDMALIGVRRSQVLERLPSPIVAVLVGSQYYWIRHYHPVALLGYISVMEGYPPTKDYVEDLQRKTGYPSQAFRTLAKHGYLDPYHRDGLDKTLDALPLQPTQEALISISAMQTVDLAARAFEEMVTHASQSTEQSHTSYAQSPSSQANKG
jgi:hypothetical protein